MTIGRKQDSKLAQSRSEDAPKRSTGRKDAFQSADKQIDRDKLLKFVKALALQAAREDHKRSLKE